MYTGLEYIIENQQYDISFSINVYICKFAFFTSMTLYFSK